MFNKLPFPWQVLQSPAIWFLYNGSSINHMLQNVKFAAPNFFILNLSNEHIS
jgi:hypothetical protein